MIARLAESAPNLVIGVDRLDYSKGLGLKFEAFAQVLKNRPEWGDNVTFLQITPKSRSAIPEYAAMEQELDTLSGRINGDYAEPDWVPLRYMTRAVPRPTLAGFMRHAKAGLVTPLRDGMNLVAKEYIAAQNPADPGALVLSRFAGAAPYLKGALLVNPLDPDEIAEALDQAMAMPLKERLERWEPMAAEVRDNSARSWCMTFLAALEG